jgi:hypothetical protein
MGSFAETATVDLITLYCLQTKENKLPFHVAFCSKPTKVCCFRFLFVANKRKMLFSVSFFFRCGIPETLRHGNMEKWRHGDMNMENGDMDMEIWRQNQKKNGKL